MSHTQAMAIIRQKPEGVSVREYTERLALQVSQLQLDWRDRAAQLQQELLRTRQELAKFQVQAETLTNIRTGICIYIYIILCSNTHILILSIQ